MRDSLNDKFLVERRQRIDDSSEDYFNCGSLEVGREMKVFMK